MSQLATSMEVGSGTSGVRLGGVVLPGILQSVEVGDEVVSNDARVASRSGKKRQPQGYDGGSITIRLQLLHQPDGLSAEQQIRVLERVFKTLDTKARPKVMRLVTKHTAARGIKDVVVRSLRSMERQGQAGVSVELGLDEHEPAVVKQERAASWKKKYAAQSQVSQEMQAAVAAGAEVVGEALSDAAWGLASLFGLSKPGSEEAETAKGTAVEAADKTADSPIGPEGPAGYF